MRYLFSLFCWWFILPLTLSAQTTPIDRLHQRLASAKSDSAKAGIYGQLCREWIKNHDFPQAEQAGKKGLHFAEQADDPKILANCLDAVGLLYWEQGYFKQAIPYYQRSLEIYERLGDQRGLANSYNHLGICYEQESHYPQALTYCLQALRLFESLRDDKSISLCHNNIGGIYAKQGMYPKALDYFRRSLKMKQKIGEQTGIAATLLNIGAIYDIQRRYQQSLDHYQQSLAIFRKIKDLRGISMCLSNMGRIYLNQDSLTASLSVFRQGLQIDEQLGDQQGITYAYISIGLVYQKLHQPLQAKTYIQKGYELAHRIGHMEYMSECALHYSAIDSALGDFTSAYRHFKQYKAYSDSLRNEAKAQEIGRIESDYRNEEQKRKLDEAQKLEQAQTERRNDLQYLIIFSGIVIFFLGMIFAGKLRLTKRLTDTALFFGVLILFEFLLLLFDPYFDRYSGGIPLYKLGMNTLVALMFASIHGILEDQLRKRLVGMRRRQTDG